MSSSGGILAGFWAAARFLTRLPAPPGVESKWERFEGAVAWFPVVGLVIGAITALVDFGVRSVASPLVASIFAVATLALLSGALHLDGLVDTFDAALAEAAPERRLEIMRDPHAGVFGTTVLVLILLAKFAAIAALPWHSRAPVLALAPVLGRWGIVAAASIFPYGRAEGLGAPLKAGATPRALALATVLPVAMIVASPPGTALLLLVAAAVTWGFSRWLMGRIPGLTGDCYGAICELVETATLLAAGPLADTLT